MGVTKIISYDNIQLSVYKISIDIVNEQKPIVTGIFIFACLLLLCRKRIISGKCKVNQVSQQIVPVSGFIFKDTVDECSSNPCNAGICSDEIDHYLCNCSSTGFEGDNCDISKPDEN